MKRRLSILFLLLIFLATGCSQQTTTTFTYRESGISDPESNAEETVIWITGYANLSEDLVIPEYYAGHRVYFISSECFSRTSIKTLELHQVVSIEPWAFRDCFELTSVKLYGTEYIGDGAFQNCDSLVSITLPATLTKIAGDAFIGCDNLRYAYFEGNPEILGNSLFKKGFGSDIPVTLYGIPGGTVEAYAKENGHIFKDIALLDELE